PFLPRMGMNLIHRYRITARSLRRPSRRTREGGSPSDFGRLKIAKGDCSKRTKLQTSASRASKAAEQAPLCNSRHRKATLRQANADRRAPVEPSSLGCRLRTSREPTAAEQAPLYR